MNLFLTTTFLAMLIAVTSSRFISPNQLIDRDETLDQNGKVRVKWHIDSVAERVSFEVIAQATGWVGFGISKSGGMTGADIVIGGVDADGNKYFEDRFSQGPSGLPRIDAQQDWNLVDATEAAGVTTLKFERKFDTGDEKEDIVIENDGVLFIWALGATDKLEYHIGERGTFPVNILEGLLPSTGDTTINTEATTVDGGENSDATTVDGGENSKATTGVTEGGSEATPGVTEGGSEATPGVTEGGSEATPGVTEGGSEATTGVTEGGSEATTDVTVTEGGSGTTTPPGVTEPPTTADSSSERNTCNLLLLVSMVFVVKRLY